MSLVVLPESDRSAVVVVGVGECVYTFEPGVPQHIPEEHVAAVTAALDSGADVVTSPAPTISHPSAATRRFAIVTVAAGPLDSAPGTGVNVTSFADVTLNWTADLTETGGYKVLESNDGGTTWHNVGTVATGITTFHYTGQTGTTYVPLGGTASTSVITPTPNYGSARHYAAVSVTPTGDAATSSTVTDSTPPPTVNSTDLVRVTVTDPDPDAEITYIVLREGQSIGTVAASGGHLDDTGQTGTTYTPSGSGSSVTVGSGPAEI